jgi:hypothetical protein
MLDRIVAAIALALIDFIANRVERGRVAVDSLPDTDRLHRAGDRIREWLRKNGARVGGEPDQGGPKQWHHDLHDGRWAVGSVFRQGESQRGLVSCKSNVCREQMMIPLSEQVFVPLHRVERISFFADYALVKFIDQRDVERIDGEDADRLRKCIKFTWSVWPKKTDASGCFASVLLELYTEAV